MTKMMVDNKKQEIKNMRNNLTFRNENDLILFDKNLGNIEDIEYKVKALKTTGSIENNLNKLNQQYMEDANSPPNKSIINKLSYRPSLGTTSSSNK